MSPLIFCATINFTALIRVFFVGEMAAAHFASPFEFPAAYFQKKDIQQKPGCVMTDQDLSELRNVLTALRTQGGDEGGSRFSLLRRALHLSRSFGQCHMLDPASLSMLGQFELARHKSYVRSVFRLRGRSDAFKTKVFESHANATRLLRAAADGGDQAACMAIARLNDADCVGPQWKPVVSQMPTLRPSLALHYYRKAWKLGETAALESVKQLLIRNARFNAAYNLSAFHGLDRQDVVDAEAESLDYHGEEAQPEEQAAGSDPADADADALFLAGLRRYYGAPGVRLDGLKQIERSAESSETARLWLKEVLNPDHSPMRYFAPGGPKSIAVDPKTHDDSFLDRTTEDLLSPLDGLVGIEDIREQFARLVDAAKMQALRRMHGMDTVPLSLHMVFTGDPGTGKTTVARLAGEILASVRLIKSAKVIETDRSSLVGEYIGQTESKTRMQLGRASGGVLFIDEAYALAGKGERDFGNEAIEVILKHMEDKRDDIVIIAAGYTDKMDAFLNANPGLRSRFTRTLTFKPLKAEAGAAMFMNWCAEYAYVPDSDVRAEVERHLSEILKKGTLARSNGRGVRTLFEEMVARQARRVIRTGLRGKDDILTVTLQDLPWKTRPALQLVVPAETVDADGTPT